MFEKILEGKTYQTIVNELNFSCHRSTVYTLKKQKKMKKMNKK